MLAVWVPFSGSPWRLKPSRVPAQVKWMTMDRFDNHGIAVIDPALKYVCKTM
jgi:hypothetical protein